MSLETYIKAFQHKDLNNIVYTNTCTKLYKIGFATDRCSFCKLEPETLNHLFFFCMHSVGYWKEFESYFHSLTNEFIYITLQDVLLGVITSICPLLNYLLSIDKIYIWECRRTRTLPNINGFKLKVKTKYETEKYIYIKNSKLDKFFYTL